MAKKQTKPSDENPRVSIDQLAAIVNTSFQHLETRLDDLQDRLLRAVTTQELSDTEARLSDLLGRIEFRATGQDQRIAILEDKLRQLATKVGMEFGKLTA